MKVAIYAVEGATLFHLSVPQMVFDEVARLGIAPWRTILFSEEPGEVRTAEGYSLGGILGPSAAEDADLVVVPAWRPDRGGISEELRGVLDASHERGATIAGLCLGAMAVAEAGLLEGRTAVTHWRAVDELARLYPGVRVDASVLYLDHGDILTSAGTASGIDACLHIVRTRLGAAAANRVARNLVVAPQREGGQAQFIEHPVPQVSSGDPVGRACEWALSNITDELSVTAMAEHARMSRRSFARAFLLSTGSTPAAWVKSQRLRLACSLLEKSDMAIDHVAAASGLTPVTFRQSFRAAFGSTPSSYRRRFTESDSAPRTQRLRRGDDVRGILA